MMARCAPLLLAMASSTFLRPPAHAGGEPCLFTCEKGECIDFVCQPCDDCQPPPAVQCASDAECHYWEHCLDGVVVRVRVDVMELRVLVPAHRHPGLVAIEHPRSRPHRVRLHLVVGDRLGRDQPQRFGA